MTSPRDYVRGKRSQADVARELGISTRQLQRIEDHALAKFLLGIARSMREAIGDIESPITVPRRFPCRISESRGQHSKRAPRGAFSSDTVRGGVHHAGLLSKGQSMSESPTTQQYLSKLEQLAVGHAEWQSTYTATRAAVDRDYAVAESAIHPFEIPPTPADAIAVYAHRIQQFPVGTFREEMQRFHLQTLRTFPAAAALARSLDAVLDCERASQANLPPPAPTETWAEVGDRAAKRARRAFSVEIAKQLAAVDGHELQAAGKALLAADEHSQRLDEIKATRDEHVSREQARLEAERLAQEQAAEAKREQRELEREIAAEVAAREARTESERERIAGFCALRQRLLRLPIGAAVQHGGRLYDARSLANGIDGWTVEEISKWTRSLDEAAS